jgi:hypothetical protein
MFLKESTLIPEVSQGVKIESTLLTSMLYSIDVDAVHVLRYNACCTALMLTQYMY